MARNFTGGDTDTDTVVTNLTTTPSAQTVALVLNRQGRGGNLRGNWWDKGSVARIYDLNSKIQIEQQWSTTNGTWNVPLPSAQFVYAIYTYDDSSTTNNPSMYYDGSSQTVTETNAPVGTANSSSNAYEVGNVSSVRCFDGDIAFFAVWDRVLSADEIALLSAGEWRRPDVIREGLVEFVDMVRDVRSYRNAVPSLTGTTQVAHPRIIPPRRKQSYRLISLGGSVAVTVPVGSLSLSGLVPTIETLTTVDVPAASLALTGLAPDVQTELSIDIPTASLGLSAFVPAVVTGSFADPPTGSLSLAGPVPFIAYGSEVEVPVGSLTVTGFAPEAKTPVIVDITSGSLGLSGFVSTIVTPMVVDIPVSILTLDGKVPITIAGVMIPIPNGSLTLVGYAPSLLSPFGINVANGSLTITGLVPLIGWGFPIETSRNRMVAVTGSGQIIEITANKKRIDISLDTKELKNS